jgi:DNA-directed RNA polymerase specialized sigma24 family protein
MALQEVAEALRVPLGTVKSRLHHARQALRQMMAPYLAESRGETS